MSTITQQVELLNKYKEESINAIAERQQSIDTCESTIERNNAMNGSLVLDMARYENEIAEIEANNAMLDEMITELQSLEIEEKTEDAAK